MTKIAYIQPIGGASGDMLLGALVGCRPPAGICCAVSWPSCPSDGYALDAAEETRCEIRGTHLKVRLEDRTRYSPCRHCSAAVEKAGWTQLGKAAGSSRSAARPCGRPRRRCTVSRRRRWSWKSWAAWTRWLTSSGSVPACGRWAWRKCTLRHWCWASRRRREDQAATPIPRRPRWSS